MASKPVIADPSLPSDSELFGMAVGQHLASVCITTTRLNEVPYAVTATPFSSVRADPPRLLVCVNRSGETEPMIRQAGVSTVTLTTGAPAHPGTVAAIDCRVSSTIEPGSHTILISDVVATVSDGAGDPLLYDRRAFRHLAPTRHGETT